MPNGSGNKACKLGIPIGISLAPNHKHNKHVHLPRVGRVLDHPAVTRLNFLLPMEQTARLWQRIQALSLSLTRSRSQLRPRSTRSPHSHRLWAVASSHSLHRPWLCLQPAVRVMCRQSGTSSVFNIPGHPLFRLHLAPTRAQVLKLDKLHSSHG